MYRNRIVILVVSLSMLLALVIPAMAQDVSPTPAPADNAAATAEPTPAPLTATTGLFVTTQFRVNVRSGPGTEYTILGKLTPVDSLDITGQNADGDWWRVNFNGQEGWVFDTVVEITGAVEGVPVVEPGATAVLRSGQVASSGTATTSGDVFITTRFNTNLRSEPSANVDVLGVVPFNTELRAEARTLNSNWVMVTFDDQSGWLFAPIVFFTSGDIASLPTMDLGSTVAPQTQAQPTQP
jgi:uncharacterized protein YraI